jgi:hypothetical protein
MAGSIAVGSNEMALPRFAPLPFPTSAGILLGTALCAHLAAIVYALTNTGLAAAVYFVGGQFALSLALLRLYNGVWVFQDLRLPMVVFLFLYGFSLPAISVLQGTTTPGLTEATLLYGTAFVGFNFVQWWFKQPWHDVPASALAWVRPTFANAALVLFGFLGVVGYAWAKGTRHFLTLDRTQMTWLYTQTWVVSMLLMTGFVMYMFAGWPSLTRNARRLVALTVLAYVIFHLGLGNRRDFLAMFLFLVGMLASRRRSVIGFRTMLVAFVAFAGFMAVGVVRQIRSAPWTLYTMSPFAMVASQNEFVMPIQTATYYMSIDRPFLLGMTYLEAPGAFIPRVLWPEKPIGLSTQFNRDKFGDVIVPGYAYTPITEAYINFSFVGPFIVLSLISLATVFLVRHARDRPLLYFLCFALVLDFNRGESAGVLYSLVVIGAAFALMRMVSQLQWTPGPFRQMWPQPALTGAVEGFRE